jgi:chromosome partitioning protein
MATRVEIMETGGATMRVISFVTQKGGAGKTTLTVNYAVAAERAGRKTLILDLDEQSSAEAWFKNREADTPRLVKIGSWKLPEAMAAAKSGGYDLVIIDTPGRDESSVNAAVRAADFVVIPCRPTPVDLRATKPTVATVDRLQKPSVFVLTQTPPRGERVREAEAALATLGVVCPVRIVARAAYQDAHGASLGVLEFDPEGKASAEIDQLWRWMTKKMEKMTYEQKETDIA